MPRTRATSDEQKQARRNRILATTRSMFSEERFDTINIAQVARESGIAKGTVYIYFKTKEEIFLALLQENYRKWFAQMDEGLDDESVRHSIPRVVSLFADSLADNPEFTQLIAIMNTQLAHNIDPEIARPFLESIREGVQDLGVKLEERLGFLNPGEGEMFLSRIQGAIIGLAHLADPAPAFASVMEEDKMKIFRVDFRQGLTDMITIMLMGLKSRMRFA